MSNWFRAYGFAGVDEGLIVGAVPLDAGDVRTLAALGVTRVLNLVEDREYQAGARKDVEHALGDAGIVEQRMSTEDYGGLSPQLLEYSATVVNAWLDQRQTVYVHCRAGWQRSATVATAVLATRVNTDPATALRYIQARKPTADPLPHQLQDLWAWWEGRQTQSTSA